MQAIIVDNFFDNFHNIENYFKKIPLYSLKDYNKKFNLKNTWPGYRSQDLSKYNPFFYNLIIKEIFQKFSILYFNQCKIRMHAHVHLRTGISDADWIHRDSSVCEKTLLVYLSDTNLKSGTCFYENTGSNPSTTVNFVQNRALLFDADIRHKSLLDYGKDIDDGRLTLNCFITKDYNGN